MKEKIKEEKRNKISKKSKIIIVIIVILLVIGAISGGVLYYRNNQVIYINSYENNAWGNRSSELKIFANGIIEGYYNYNGETKTKRAKISDEDLKKLKDLSNMVNDNYKEGLNPESILNPNSLSEIMAGANDTGFTEEKIYSNKEKKWIILYQSGDIMGYNDTDETKEIIELIEQLYTKYINGND